MINIIQSLMEYEDLWTLISYENLSPQENEYLKFIKESKDNSGKYPTTDLISRQYPELHFEDSMGDPIPVLSEQDSYVYISNFFKKRDNLKKSQLLMKLAAQVADTGVTPDIVDQISSQTISHEVVESTIDSVESLRNYYEMKKDKPEGIKTNVKAIDDKIGGLPYGTVMTIAGFTSHGKSLFANNIAFYNTFLEKYNCCILSLEVPKEQVFSSMLLRLSQEPEFSSGPKFSASAFGKGRMKEDQEDFVFNELVPYMYDYKTHGKMVIYDESDIRDTKMSTMKELLLKADEECRRDTGYPLDFILVDHIQLLKFDSGSKKSEMETINAAVSFFHKLALDFRTVDGEVQQLGVIILSQINRDGFKKAMKKKGAYNLTALADANELERSSQVIITIYMDQDNKTANEAMICLLKNRAGECITEPETIYCCPSKYFCGDTGGGFAEGFETNELEDIFGGGSISDFM